MAEGRTSDAVWFDLPKARQSVEGLKSISESAGEKISTDSYQYTNRPALEYGMKQTVRNLGWRMKGILTDYVYGNADFASRPGLNRSEVDQSVIEVCQTLTRMCDEVQKYLEVVPGVVQKQILLCEIADRIVTQMQGSGGQTDRISSTVEHTERILGHDVS